MPDDDSARMMRAALAPGQVSWGGLLLGAGTPWRWGQLDGWEDLPGLDSGDVARPSRHGAWGGRDLAQPRVVTLAGQLACRRSQVPAMVAALRSATRVADDAELLPLAVNAWGEELLAWARPTQRLMPLAKGARLGLIPYTLQWTCPDPRRYSVEEHTREILAPVRPADGLDYPLGYPLDYGAPMTGGAATLTNQGTTGAHPVVTITGPCDRPQIVNRATGRALEFALTLAQAETLVVDCDAGTVLLSGSADRLYTRTPASVPVEAWTLPPGAAAIQFRPLAAGPGSSAVVRWRDAYL
ncbi:phage tail domain-containing protein [Nocardiopsis sp. HUAS JQ3]|uniref:phage distal tail protein n=1 Tax=Nocardiopsis sp. HUAS JQ3 TaxID=3061629 RepID=UPI0023A92D11|nr:phage tail domain-containing protein [Nocardiopsis sp. HUAS JQ3]WDZ91139.1 phage tail family protein [Nocardiopsis sp. HUAS JQ3]